MEYVWIGFEKDININIVMNAIKERFNLLKCYRYDNIEQLADILKELKMNYIREYKSIIFYEINKNNSEFPIILEFPWFDDLAEEVRIDVYIAYYLSRVLKCKTITDGTGLGIDGDIPYQDIIFDNGNAFLVDDMETKFCGDGDRGLKFVRKLDLKEISRNL